MLTHVKVIAWLHIVLGGLGILAAVGLLLLFGGIAGLVGATDHSQDARIAIPILGGIGAILFIVIALMSIPGIIAGFGLLKFAPWARILTIVLSALHILNIPIGTAIGIYSLWVLTNRETEQLFSRQPYQPATY
jgi:hypothetical protein